MSELTLTAADVARLEGCMRTLLTPLDHADVDGWRRSVNRAVRGLLGSDMATFQLPSPPSGEVLYSQEIDAEDARKYLPLLDEVDPKYRDRAFRRTVELGVCTRRMLWHDELDEFYASRYYNEFVVPVRAFDMVCAAVPVADEKVPASLLVHRTDPQCTPFGEREVSLLRLLYPAFVAGARTFHRFRVGQQQMLGVLDQIGDPVLIFDTDTRPRHKNAAYERLGLNEGQDRVILGCARQLAAGLAELWKERRSRTQPEGGRAIQAITAAGRRFVLEGSTFCWGTASPSILLVVREQTARPVGGEASESREYGRALGLTSRESEVAVLLTERFTNREIAQGLGISVHTVRRHVERVFGKLGVRSRRDVPSALIEREAQQPQP